MDEKTALGLIVRPTLAMFGSKYQGRQAEAMLLAIALQESRFQYRQQIGGPAHGWWQFERGGGVRGVLSHHASRDTARLLCDTLGYPADESAVYAGIVHNDVLACGFARLLLYTDADPLPVSEDDGWNYYLRNWRPGKPHPKTWGEMWRRAVIAVGA